MSHVTFYLARQEFFLPFRTLFKKSTPGGRDFLWLTVLVMLIFCCALLLYSIKQGLTDRFVDVLLGSVPNAGIPIWIQPHPFGTKQVIDEGMLAQIKTRAEALKEREDEQRIPLFGVEKALTVHPYSDINPNFIALPDEAEVWPEKHYRFKGIAVYQNDPLWRYAMGRQGEKTNSFMHIVLSRSLVEKHFKYELYLDKMSQVLPNRLLESLPQTKKALVESESPSLWMVFGKSQELLPVKVTWVERLPIPGNHVFLFSARFYHALQFSFHNSNLNYFPESAQTENATAATPRALGLVFTGESDEALRNQFAQCMGGGGELHYGSGFHYLTLRTARPLTWLDACRDQLKLDGIVQVERPVTSDTIDEKRGVVDIRCSKWPDELLSDEERGRCEDDNQSTIQREAPVISGRCGIFPSHEWTPEERVVCRNDDTYRIERRMTDKVGDFYYAFLYVPDRNRLNDAMALMDNLPGKPLFLTATYEDSLKRFGALSEILSKLGFAFFGLAALFLLVLLYVQLSTLIGHRRHCYGILLAKGMSHRDLYAILSVQLGFVVAIGFSLALLITSIIRYSIEQGILEVADRFSAVLTLSQSSLLPLTFVDYAIVLTGGMGVILMVGFRTLRGLPLKRGTAPEDLFNVA